MKCLDIYLTKDAQGLQEENYKSLIKEIKELKEWKDILCACTGRLNIVQMLVFSQLDAYIQSIPNQNLYKSFCILKNKTDSKVYIERQKTQNSQYNMNEKTKVKGLIL